MAVAGKELDEAEPAGPDDIHGHPEAAEAGLIPVKGRPGAPELRKLWSLHDQRPHFFCRLQIAEDGGFSQIQKLFVWERFVWAIFSVTSLLVNMYTLTVPNILVLSESTWFQDASSSERLLIINRLILHEIFQMEKQLRPEVLVAIMELFLICLLLCWSGFILGRSLWLNRHADVMGWDAAAHLFFDLLPELSTISAMRLLYYVTPSIFIPALGIEVAGLIRRRGKKFGIPLLLFLLRRLLAGIVGFDAFLVKFHNAALKTDNLQVLDAFMAAGAFLNQLLGVVNVNMFARERLLRYIFGGPDGDINPREQLRQKTWHAMLVERIWVTARKRTTWWLPATAWFAAVLLAYSDADFQSLTLDELAKGQDKQRFMEPPKEDPVQPFA